MGLLSRRAQFGAPLLRVPARRRPVPATKLDAPRNGARIVAILSAGGPAFSLLPSHPPREYGITRPLVRRTTHSLRADSHVAYPLPVYPFRTRPYDQAQRSTERCGAGEVAPVVERMPQARVRHAFLFSENGILLTGPETRRRSSSGSTRPASAWRLSVARAISSWRPRFRRTKSGSRSRAPIGAERPTSGSSRFPAGSALD